MTSGCCRPALPACRGWRGPAGRPGCRRATAVVRPGAGLPCAARPGGRLRWLRLRPWTGRPINPPRSVRRLRRRTAPPVLRCWAPQTRAGTPAGLRACIVSCMQRRWQRLDCRFRLFNAAILSSHAQGASKRTGRAGRAAPVRCRASQPHRGSPTPQALDQARRIYGPVRSGRDPKPPQPARWGEKRRGPMPQASAPHMKPPGLPAPSARAQRLHAATYPPLTA